MKFLFVFHFLLIFLTIWDFFGCFFFPLVYMVLNDLFILRMKKYILIIIESNKAFYGGHIKLITTTKVYLYISNK